MNIKEQDKIILEGIDDVLHDMGYFFDDKGKNKGKWVHDKSGHTLSDKEAQEKAAKRHGRKNKLNPYQRARERSAKDDPEKRLSMKRAERRREQKQETKKQMKNESFDLFPKDTDRLLREHIRAEYEARGIYPTAREVQETFNQVMNLIERSKTPEQREASRMLRQGASGKEVKDTIGRKRTPEGKSGNALLRKANANAEYQAMMQGHTSDDNGDPLLDRIVAHKARRGKQTKISPSSPARQQSDIERRTRASGTTSTQVIDMMNKLRKTNR